MMKMHARNPFTLLVRQSGECVSRYFCSYKVYDARFSRLEQKELFSLSSSSLILDQQERYLPLIVLKGNVPHVCVCVCMYIHIPASCMHLRMEYKMSCTWYADQLVFNPCSVVSDCSKWNLCLKTYMLFSFFISWQANKLFWDETWILGHFSSFILYVP